MDDESKQCYVRVLVSSCSESCEDDCSGLGLGAEDLEGTEYSQLRIDVGGGCGGSELGTRDDGMMERGDGKYKYKKYAAHE